MSLSFQIRETLDQVDTVLIETDPTNAEEARQLGELANSAQALAALADNPPRIIGSAWSLVPSVGLANVLCPGSNCLELFDSEPSVYKEQCVSGILSSVNPCSEYLAQVHAILNTIGAQLITVGAPEAAEVALTAGEGAGNIAETSANVTQPTIGALWQDSPDWLKYGSAAVVALLLIKAIK
jgi:hypothetical protein